MSGSEEKYHKITGRAQEMAMASWPFKNREYEAEMPQIDVFSL